MDVLIWPVMYRIIHLGGSEFFCCHSANPLKLIKVLRLLGQSLIRYVQAFVDWLAFY